MARDVKGIPYKMVRVSDTISENPKQGLMPCIARRGTISTDLIVDKLADTSSFTGADIHGVIRGLIDQIETHLKLGYNVTIDGLGTFSLAAEGIIVEKEGDIRANSIKVKRVVFKNASSFLKRFTNAVFQKQESKN